MNRCFKSIAFAALSVPLLLLTVMSHVAHGKIVINEGMINPLDTKPGQWIELYNTAATPVDLTNWTISLYFPSFSFPDNTTLPDGAVIQGNGYFVFGDATVFAVDGSAAGEAGLNGIAILSPAQLATGMAEDILLWDTSGEKGADKVLPFQVAPGASLMRKDPNGATQDPNNWTPSTTYYQCRDDENRATKGLSNAYVCPLELSGLDLYHAASDTLIVTLTNGTTVRPDAQTPRMSRGPTFNIVATYKDSQPKIESVVFRINDKRFRTEAKAPFALCGNNGKDISSCGSTLGCDKNYTVTATPYNGTDGTGTAGKPFTVSFAIACRK